MQLTDGLKAGAAALATILVGGILYGQISPGAEAPSGHLVVPGAAVGTYRVWATLQPSAAIEVAVMHLASADARDELALAAACVVPVDGGADPGQYALPGMPIVYDEITATPCVPGVDPQIEVWLQRRTDVPWPCACAKGPACIWTHALIDHSTVTDAAPMGRTLTAGTWAGVDCVPKACAFNGIPDGGDMSWPLACPTR